MRRSCHKSKCRNLRWKILGATKIFLKSRFVCTISNRWKTIIISKLKNILRTPERTWHQCDTASSIEYRVSNIFQNNITTLYHRFCGGLHLQGHQPLNYFKIRKPLNFCNMLLFIKQKCDNRLFISLGRQNFFCN